MAVSDEMMKHYINDEAREEGNLANRILADALLIKMSEILSASKK